MKNNSYYNSNIKITPCHSEKWHVWPTLPYDLFIIGPSHSRHLYLPVSQTLAHIWAMHLYERGWVPSTFLLAPPSQAHLPQTRTLPHPPHSHTQSTSVQTGPNADRRGLAGSDVTWLCRTGLFDHVVCPTGKRGSASFRICCSLCLLVRVLTPDNFVVCLLTEYEVPCSCVCVWGSCFAYTVETKRTTRITKPEISCTEPVVPERK